MSERQGLRTMASLSTGNAMSWFQGFEEATYPIPGGWVHARVGGRRTKPALAR